MVGWDYQTERAQHQSQVDAKKGFGGRFGVQKDRQDKVEYYVSHTHKACVLKFGDCSIREFAVELEIL